MSEAAAVNPDQPCLITISSLCSCNDMSCCWKMSAYHYRYYY